MFTMRHCTACMLLLVCGFDAQTLLAQQAGQRINQEQKQFDDEEEEEAPANPGLNDAHYTITPMNLEMWVFQNRVVVQQNGIARVQQVPRNTRDQLETDLTARIQKDGTEHHLSEPERKKLLLAGRGEIWRLMDQLDELKRTGCNHPITRVELMELHGKAQRLGEQFRLAATRTEQSLYRKTLRRILQSDRPKIDPTEPALRDPDPMEPGEGSVPANDLDYCRMIANFVGKGLGPDLPLKRQQQLLLAQMLHEELRRQPMFTFKDPVIPWLRLSTLPEKAWKSVLDQAQWERLEQKFVEARAAAGAVDNKPKPPKPGDKP